MIMLKMNVSEASDMFTIINVCYLAIAIIFNSAP